MFWVDFLKLVFDGNFYSLSTFSSSAATASPTSMVLELPPISFVLTPLSIVLRTASSTALASAGKFREYLSIIAIERIVPTGFTIPWPDISGADPGTGLAPNPSKLGGLTYHELARRYRCTCSSHLASHSN